MPALQHLKVVGPASEKCAVALPAHKPNAAYRSREHLSERGAPFSNRGFQALLTRGPRRGLANDGVDTRAIQSYLGHKSIQHTVRYTELAPTRFRSLFRD